MTATMSDESVDTARWKDIKALAERVVSSPTLAFVGAGSSRRLGYPTWSWLPDELEHYVLENRLMSEEELEQLKSDMADDPVWLTSLFKARMGRRLGGLHRQTLRTAGHRDRGFPHRSDREPVPPLPHHERVRRAGEGSPQGAQRARAIGQLARRAGVQRVPRADERAHVQAPLRAPARTTADLQDVVLTERDYLRRYEDLTTLLRLFAIFSTQSVVFIGFSLSDPDFVSMLRRIRSHGPGMPRHFAFLLKPPNQRDLHIRERLRARGERRTASRDETLKEPPPIPSGGCFDIGDEVPDQYRIERIEPKPR